jgi:hypothetical protein
LAADGAQHGLASGLAFLGGLQGLLPGCFLSFRRLPCGLTTGSLALGLRTLGVEAGYALRRGRRALGFDSLRLAPGRLSASRCFEPGRLQALRLSACGRLATTGLKARGLFVLGRHAGGRHARGLSARGCPGLSFLARSLAARSLRAVDFAACCLRALGIAAQGIRPFSVAAHGFRALGVAAQGFRAFGLQLASLGLSRLGDSLLRQALPSLTLQTRRIHAWWLRANDRIRR